MSDSRRFYVAASTRDRVLARAVISALRLRGHDVTYDWTATDEKAEVWDFHQRRTVAAAEIQGVRDADGLILIGPGGRGAHVELGAALGKGIGVLHCFFMAPNYSLFYEHPLVAPFASIDPQVVAAAADTYPWPKP